METLLLLIVAVTGAAVVTQAIVLILIWRNSMRLADQMDRFMKDTRELLAPVKTITENLCVASNNLVEIGVAAREQFRRVENMVNETGEALHVHIERFDNVSRDIAIRINETAQIFQNSVVKPFREVSALAKGVTRGLDAFLFRRSRSTVDQANQDEELFI